MKYEIGYNTNLILDSYVDVLESFCTNIYNTQYCTIFKQINNHLKANYEEILMHLNKAQETHIDETKINYFTLGFSEHYREQRKADKLYDSQKEN